jgi:prolyl-tRNA synthetase
LLAFSDTSDFACNVELIEEKDIDKIPGMPSPDGKGSLQIKKGIEVGHIFQLGDKYSKALGLKVQSDNTMKFLQMGCYGIGISRIIAACIEQNYDDKGIIFPKGLAPFDITIILINQKNNSLINEKALMFYKRLKESGFDILLDDRDCSPGVKFSDADLVGCPNQIVVSQKTLDNDAFEVINRSDLSKKELSESDLFAFFC